MWSEGCPKGLWRWSAGRRYQIGRSASRRYQMVQSARSQIPDRPVRAAQIPDRHWHGRCFVKRLPNHEENWHGDCSRGVVYGNGDGNDGKENKNEGKERGAGVGRVGFAGSRVTPAPRSFPFLVFFVSVVRVPIPVYRTSRLTIPMPIFLMVWRPFCFRTARANACLVSALRPRGPAYLVSALRPRGLAHLVSALRLADRPIWYLL